MFSSAFEGWGTAGALVALLLLSSLVLPGPAMTPTSVPPPRAPVAPTRAAAPPLTHSGHGVAMSGSPHLLPGLGPRASTLPTHWPSLPSVNSAERSQDLPRLPPADRATRYAPAPTSPPTDLNVTGTTFLLISSDTTVRNLTVQDNATLEVNNAATHVTLTVLGNILLKGDSLFYLNHSTLLTPETYNFEQSMVATNGAHFSVFSSNVTSNGNQWSLSLDGNSNATILGSNFSYPGSWTVTGLSNTASLNVFVSFYLSDVLMFDLPPGSSSARFHASYALGFNTWLNLGSGQSASLTLPSPLGFRNWTFPGGQSVTGVNYQVGLYYCYTLYFAVMLWQGSNVSLSNSVGVVVALNPTSGTLSVSGLRETTYAAFGLQQDGFALHLSNTGVHTWNLYPFSSTLVAWNSTIGEVQSYGTGGVFLHNDTLSGDGGYYGDQGIGPFDIRDSVIESQVLAYSGVVSLVNCSVSTAAPERVLAVGSGLVRSTDTYLSVNDSYQVEQSGTVVVDWHLQVTVTDSGRGLPGATLEANWTTNGTGVSTGQSGGAGTVSMVLPQYWLRAAGRSFAENYSLTAWGNDSSASGNVQMDREVSLNLSVSPMIQGTSPANGSTAVPTNTNATIRFSQPMDGALTAAHVSVSGGTSFSSQWDPSWRNLTLVPTGGWAPAQPVVVTLSPGGTTAQGLPLTTRFQFSFTTASALVGVSVSPPNATLAAGGSLSLQATPSCTGGPCPTGILYVWSLTNRGATLNASVGNLVLLTAGTRSGGLAVFVNASFGGQVVESGPVVVQVNAPSPVLTGVSLTPPSATVDTGASTSFVAAPVCSGGPCPTGLLLVWSLAPSLGGLNTTSGPEVTYTAGSVAGSTTLTVNASLDGVWKTSAGQLTVQVPSGRSGGNGSSSSPWTSNLGWVVLAVGIVAVVALTAIYVLVVRRKGGRPGASTPPPSEEPRGATPP